MASGEPADLVGKGACVEVPFSDIDIDAPSPARSGRRSRASGASREPS